MNDVTSLTFNLSTSKPCTPPNGPDFPSAPVSSHQPAAFFPRRHPAYSLAHLSKDSSSWRPSWITYPCQLQQDPSFHVHTQFVYLPFYMAPSLSCLKMSEVIFFFLFELHRQGVASLSVTSPSHTQSRARMCLVDKSTISTMS